MFNLERRQITADILIRNITQRVCVATAIISSEGTKSLGTVLMTNSMQTECAKTAILIAITVNAEKRKKKKRIKYNHQAPSSFIDFRINDPHLALLPNRFKQ